MRSEFLALSLTGLLLPNLAWPLAAEAAGNDQCRVITSRAFLTSSPSPSRAFQNQEARVNCVDSFVYLPGDNRLIISYIYNSNPPLSSFAPGDNSKLCQIVISRSYLTKSNPQTVTTDPRDVPCGDPLTYYPDENALNKLPPTEAEKGRQRFFLSLIPAVLAGALTVLISRRKSSTQSG